MDNSGAYGMEVGGYGTLSLTMSTTIWTTKYDYLFDVTFFFFVDTTWRWISQGCVRDMAIRLQ